MWSCEVLWNMWGNTVTAKAVSCSSTILSETTVKVSIFILFSSFQTQCLGVCTFRRHAKAGSRDATVEPGRPLCRGSHSGNGGTRFGDCRWSSPPTLPGWPPREVSQSMCFPLLRVQLSNRVPSSHSSQKWSRWRKSQRETVYKVWQRWFPRGTWQPNNRNWKVCWTDTDSYCYCSNKD